MPRTFKFEWSKTPENLITSEELLSAERSLARLVAAAYADEHPEEFADKRHRSLYNGGQPSKNARARRDAKLARGKEGRATAGGIHGSLE